MLPVTVIEAMAGSVHVNGLDSHDYDRVVILDAGAQYGKVRIFSKSCI
jgi:hypothetical protein